MSRKSQSQQLLAWLLELLLLWHSLAPTEQYCHVMKMLSQSVWDTPSYGLDLRLHTNNNSLSSATHVREEVAIPLWHLVLLQHHNVRKAVSSNEAPRTLYNATYRTCELWKYMRRIQVFKNVAQLVLSKKSGNMSIACPLKVGTYVMNIIQVPPDTGILKFMYLPNTLYTLIGTVYALDPRDQVSKRPLCRYEINATIYKTC